MRPLYEAQSFELMNEEHEMHVCHARVLDSVSGVYILHVGLAVWQVFTNFRLHWKNHSVLFIRLTRTVSIFFLDSYTRRDLYYVFEFL